MSRIGRKPVELPEKVQVTVDGRAVKVVGPLGTLDTLMPEGVTLDVDDDLNGGLLNIENNIFVKPKTNRFVLFSPGLLHGVEEFTGKRSSFLVNPWKTKPLPY